MNFLSIIFLAGAVAFLVYEVYGLIKQVRENKKNKGG